MKKILALSFVLFFTLNLFCQSPEKKTAIQLKTEALKEDSIQDSIDFLKANIELAQSNSDKRAILYFLGNLQEQLGLYTDACKTYVKAAAITASNVNGMKKVSSEQIVLDAVRTSLCSGDWENAQRFLNSSVRSSKNEKIICYVNLYEIWAKLCKAADFSQVQDSLVLLEAYLKMESMSFVKREIAFTLWYLTEKEEYAKILREEFPLSVETGILTGKVQIASVPFWYFVPRANLKNDFTAMKEKLESSNFSSEEKKSENIKQSSEIKSEIKSELKSEKQNAENNKNTNHEKLEETQVSTKKVNLIDKNLSNEEKLQNLVEKSKSENKETLKEKSPELTKVKKRQQVGFYKDKKNALDLVNKLKQKGFNAYTFEEIRSSGTKYTVVVVDENPEETMGKKLKEAGFDCYPIK